MSERSGCRWIRGLLLAGLLCGTSSCADSAREAAPQTELARLAGAPDAEAEYDERHWSVSPATAERAFSHGRLRVMTEEYAGRGLTGALRVTLDLLDEGKEIQAKWKPSPGRLDALNNSPRRELAAYEVQKLFLDPVDYVVPTSKLRCLKASEFASPEDHQKVTIKGSDCRIGVFSLWLDNVRLPDPLMDAARLSDDPTYARYLADFNLATYLMNHKDGRNGNFLVAKDERRRRVFAIDNGVAFSGLAYNWFVRNWKELRVPALRKIAVDRLRTLTRSDVERLGVVAQFEERKNDDGTISIEMVEPTENLDPDDGVRSRDGVTQLGLNEDEVKNLWERIEDLIKDVDKGDVTVF